ncbi:uncharacterized protein LOC120688079 isoform X2 [Panicum virgatum]|uniref:uncharacterized protein LOC120688079 isoform X2 n=1 Tax=Panicum virgatum TaxID=38727 RepID=UPI0019D56C90|nr:uncharacterized protein LOC120688079 isoform X2 [Panicum virgatum]
MLAREQKDTNYGLGGAWTLRQYTCLPPRIHICSSSGKMQTSQVFDNAHTQLLLLSSLKCKVCKESPRGCSLQFDIVKLVADYRQQRHLDTFSRLCFCSKEAYMQELQVRVLILL